jgi:hypothetical protein
VTVPHRVREPTETPLHSFQATGPRGSPCGPVPAPTSGHSPTPSRTCHPCAAERLLPAVWSTLHDAPAGTKRRPDEIRALFSTHGLPGSPVTVVTRAPDTTVAGPRMVPPTS